MGGIAGLLVVMIPPFTYLSVPVLAFAVLMRLVGRIGKRAITIILAVEVVLWILTCCCWSIMDHIHRMPVN